MRAFRNLICLQIQRIFSYDWGERHVERLVETWLALKWKENGHEGVIYLLDRILRLQQYLKIANFLILFAYIRRKLKSWSVKERRQGMILNNSWKYCFFYDFKWHFIIYLKLHFCRWNQLLFSSFCCNDHF